MELYFQQPAACWQEGFPLGNGRLGVVLCGDPYEETLYLNEDTLWAGSPDSSQKGLKHETIQQAKKLAAETKYQEATAKIEEDLAGSEDVQPYLPFGRLLLSFPNKGTITCYQRRLDLEKAVSYTDYLRDGIAYHHLCFVSAPAEGILLQVRAEEPFSVKVTVSPSLPAETTYENHSFWVSGICPGHSGLVIDAPDTVPQRFQYHQDPKMQGIRFQAHGELRILGGFLESGKDGILCRGISSLEIRLGIRTNFSGWNLSPGSSLPSPGQLLSEDFSKMEPELSALLSEHILDYSSFFSRTDFQLGGNSRERQDLKQRLIHFQEDSSDLQLFPLLFAYGKYLLISSSRPGTEASNLQGIWNKDLIPPWFCDFTLNINTEMNYWMTGPLRLHELFEPFLRLSQELMLSGQKTARELFHTKGSLCFHNTDLWRKTTPSTGKAVWAFWPFGLAWMCRNLYDEYLFRQDQSYLEKILPILRESVLFFLENLSETEKGLAFVPATSPENLFMDRQIPVSVALYSENTLAILRNLFQDYLSSLEHLHQTEPMEEPVRNALKRLVPTKMGSQRQILEWNEEFAEEDSHHRHCSHLFELHPGRGISEKTPQLFEAAKTSLLLRQDEGTGWSLAWKLMMWARLKDGEHAQALLLRMLHLVDPASPASVHGGGVYPNLFCAHPPFQIDGNLGFTAAVAELLVQSHSDELSLLPALPPAWKSGMLRGFCARGNILVDLDWDETKVSFTLTSPKEVSLSLRIKKGTPRFVSLKPGIPFHEVQPLSG